MTEPGFPPKRLDQGDTDWRARRRTDGYDYAQAATAGASLARAALATRAGKAQDAPVRASRPTTGPAPARNPFDSHKPRVAAPVGMPVYVDPDEDIPWPDEPPPEEDWQ